jgi:ketosteroid isomerase-like protein
VDTDAMIAVLWDIEQIKQLKARYFRFMDTRDWDGLLDVFTEDCRIEVPEADWVVDGRTTFIERLRAAITPGVSTHHGHMPEITLDGPDRATGIWAMFDYVRAEPVDGPPAHIQGYGHYHETYVKEADGRWRIRSLRLTRLRIDEL